eukprot:108328-Rhodomonas_salina.1
MYHVTSERDEGESVRGHYRSGSSRGRKRPRCTTSTTAATRSPYSSLCTGSVVLGGARGT